ncbi:hypothetical protein Asd1617_03714 [Shigella dysenteriae 1617]|uniref:Uncharacterized protein n=1 Tax=Shigella dysenteriae 1617 TaxID=754093 RepID=A0A0A6ZY12_SHIDY|nr:hypothetical protein Asd1617_03714 [Shigella dysenteriae 1617]
MVVSAIASTPQLFHLPLTAINLIVALNNGLYHRCGQFLKFLRRQLHLLIIRITPRHR